MSEPAKFLMGFDPSRPVVEIARAKPLRRESRCPVCDQPVTQPSYGRKTYCSIPCKDLAMRILNQRHGGMR